jgi:hypothetical protein
MKQALHMQTSKKTPLPELPQGAPGRPDKPRYKRQFGVIVLLEGEEAQAAAYDQLKGMDYKCRVVTT